MYTRVCVYVCVYACVCVRVYRMGHMKIFMYACLFTQHPRAYTHPLQNILQSISTVHIYIYMHSPMCMYEYMCMHECVCGSVCVWDQTSNSSSCIQTSHAWRNETSSFPSPSLSPLLYTALRIPHHTTPHHTHTYTHTHTHTHTRRRDS
jgi:hypothetical protein